MSYSTNTAATYLQQTQRYLRELNKYTQMRRAAYYRELAPRAAAAAHRNSHTLPAGSLVFILRPRATKLLIPHSGPYPLVSATQHTYTLRNIATGFTFVESKSNVAPLAGFHLAGPEGRAPGIEDMLGGHATPQQQAGKDRTRRAGEGNPPPSPHTSAAH